MKNTSENKNEVPRINQELKHLFSHLDHQIFVGKEKNGPNLELSLYIERTDISLTLTPYYKENVFAGHRLHVKDKTRKVLFATFHYPKLPGERTALEFYVKHIVHTMRGLSVEYSII